MIFWLGEGVQRGWVGIATLRGRVNQVYEMYLVVLDSVVVVVICFGMNLPIGFFLWNNGMNSSW